jgi:hypothetical protein
MVTVVLATPATVVTVYVADELPAGTVTEAGTVAAAVLDEERPITKLAAATPFSVTVPVAVDPAATDAGAIVIDVSCGGMTNSTAVAVY